LFDVLTQWEADYLPSWLTTKSALCMTKLDVSCFFSRAAIYSVTGLQNFRMSLAMGTLHPLLPDR